jgi:hypothetical protein
MQAVLKSFPAKVSDLAVLGFGTLTPTAQREYHHFVIRGMSFQPSDLVSCAQRKRNFPYDFEATSSSGLLTFLAIVVGPVPEIWSDEHKGK